MDESRFDDLFLFEYPRLVGALGLVTGDRDVATNAVDEACALAWERLRRGKEIESLAAWVRVAALRVARGRVRRHATEERARVRLAGLAIGAAKRTDIGFDTRDALARLPRRQREVVVLHYFLDLPVDDIAAQLEIDNETVNLSLQRARAVLAVALADRNDQVRDGAA